MFIIDSAPVRTSLETTPSSLTAAPVNMAKPPLGVPPKHLTVAEKKRLQWEKERGKLLRLQIYYYSGPPL